MNEDTRRFAIRHDELASQLRENLRRLQEAITRNETIMTPRLAIPPQMKRTPDLSRVLLWWAGTDSNRRTETRADLQSGNRMS